MEEQPGGVMGASEVSAAPRNGPPGSEGQALRSGERSRLQSDRLQIDLLWGQNLVRSNNRF